MNTLSATPETLGDIASVLARAAALDERNRLLEEENRWLKAQLFGRSSEKMPLEDRSPDQAWLFNEIEVTAQATPDAPQTITIPAYDRAKRGRKKLAADIPRVEVVHDLSAAEKICPSDGATLERIGEETSEQLEFVPARVQRPVLPRDQPPARLKQEHGTRHRQARSDGWPRRGLDPC
jgi:transposase